MVDVVGELAQLRAKVREKEVGTSELAQRDGELLPGLDGRIDLFDLLLSQNAKV